MNAAEIARPKRLVFITGSLAPGRDGVGDYARTLGAHCAVAGHDVRWLSLGEPEEPGADDSRERRFSAAAVRADGGAAARRWLEEFAPDWASLQFVPYSFDPRGLFGARVPMLADLLGTARRRHVFFHEIWIGIHRGASPRERLVGWVQRRAVRALLRRTAPECVHTSTAYNALVLERAGQRAGRLAMFGSVPRLADIAPAALEGVPAQALVCGIFGSVHANWQPETFLADFAQLARQRGQPAALVTAGGIGPGATLLSQLEERWRAHITFVRLGRATTERLAEIFARFDFAVTSMPWNILGKSSSAAALREHGVKIVVTAAGAPPRQGPLPVDDTAEDAGFIPYFRDAARLAEAPGKTEPRPGAREVARNFLADLESHER